MVEYILHALVMLTNRFRTHILSNINVKQFICILNYFEFHIWLDYYLCFVLQKKKIKGWLRMFNINLVMVCREEYHLNIHHIYTYSIFPYYTIIFEVETFCGINWNYFHLFNSHLIIYTQQSINVLMSINRYDAFKYIYNSTATV